MYFKLITYNAGVQHFEYNVSGDFEYKGRMTRLMVDIEFC